MFFLSYLAISAYAAGKRRQSARRVGDAFAKTCVPRGNPHAKRNIRSSFGLFRYFWRDRRLLRAAARPYLRMR
jgi:hypothetical protein